MFVRVIRIFHEYENRFYLRVRFIKTVYLDRRRNSDKKKREKKNCILNRWKANISTERNTFSKLGCLSFINFFHRKTSRLHECSKTFLPSTFEETVVSRQQNIDFTTTVSRTFPTPFHKISFFFSVIESIFFPPIFLFFLRCIKSSPRRISRKRIRSC